MNLYCWISIVILVIDFEFLSLWSLSTNLLWEFFWLVNVTSFFFCDWDNYLLTVILMWILWSLLRNLLWETGRFDLHIENFDFYEVYWEVAVFRVCWMVWLENYDTVLLNLWQSLSYYRSWILYFMLSIWVCHIHDGICIVFSWLIYDLCTWCRSMWVDGL
jgi:hypothetical protein